MILETILVIRPGPSPPSSPPPSDCFGGITANATVANHACQSFSQALAFIIPLVLLVIAVKVLTYLLNGLSDHSSQPIQRTENDEDDERSFMRRFFYRRKKKREEDGDSQT